MEDKPTFLTTYISYELFHLFSTRKFSDLLTAGFSKKPVFQWRMQRGRDGAREAAGAASPGGRDGAREATGDASPGRSTVCHGAAMLPLGTSSCTVFVGVI